MLFYAPGNEAYITDLIDLLGLAELDQIVGGVLVGVLYGVIQPTGV